MALYPLQVELNERKIRRIQRSFRLARAAIENELLGATDFGVANRLQILGQIDQILQVLANNTGTAIQQELRFYYEGGAKDADKQLKNIGIDVKTDFRFNKIHREAINALLDDTAKLFAESMTGVARNARVTLGKAVREEITQRMAKGQISGEALKDTKAAIKEVIRNEGITALHDRAGRKWDLDRYSEMLIRTKAVESRNRGLANRMVQNGYDLVQVSNHNSDHAECARWEGRILSITGETKGYPTLAEAEAGGLFHPNCKHAVNVLIPSLARETKAYAPDERTEVISKAEIEKATRLERERLPKT